MTDTCPHCSADLRGAEIPAKDQSYYGQTHFDRTIGVEIPGVYDGVLYWMCPDCGGCWNRWDQETAPHRHAQAEFWMSAPIGGAQGPAVTRPALDSLVDLIGPDAAIKAMDWLVREMHDFCETRDRVATVIVENDKLPPPTQVAIDSYHEATADLRDWADSLRYELWLELCGGVR